MNVETTICIACAVLSWGALLLFSLLCERTRRIINESTAERRRWLREYMKAIERPLTFEMPVSENGRNGR